MSPLPPLRRANNGEITEGAGGAFLLLSEASESLEQTFGAAIPESTWSLTAQVCQTANLVLVATDELMVEAYAEFCIGPGYINPTGRAFARLYRNGPISQSDLFIRRLANLWENVAAGAFPTDAAWATVGDILVFQGRVRLTGLAGSYNWALQWGWYDAGAGAQDRIVIRNQAIRVWQEIGD